MSGKDESSMSVPKNWKRFLEWFCPNELQEGILGDLLEQFEADLEIHSQKYARRHFIWNVIRLLHPSLLFRNKFNFEIMNIAMIRSHLLVSLRSMKKQKFYSTVNIIGLSLALAFVFLGLFFLKSEYQYDRFHQEKDNIYRLYHQSVNEETGQITQSSAVTAIPLSKDVHNSLPFIREHTRVGSSSSTIISESTPYDEVISFVDPGFLKMFDFKLLKGNPETALDLHHSMILSEEKALKYFGTIDPIGKTLDMVMNDSMVTHTVTGIIDNQKNRSSIQFDILTPLDQYRNWGFENMFESYNYGIVENYILVEPNTDKIELVARINEVIPEDDSNTGVRMDIGLQQLTDIHFETGIIGNAQFSNPLKIYILISLSLLVLIIASINYITLSTGHVLNRLREMGVRKTMGALSNQLGRQLLIESIFLVIISSVFGLLFAFWGIPWFEGLINSQISLEIGWFEFSVIIGIILTVALLSGILQSFVVLKHKTVDAIKGQIIYHSQKNRLRESLVVLQFALCIILIIGALLIRNQMNFVMNKDLGYEEERLIEISLGNPKDLNAAKQLVDRFRTRVLQDVRILKVSASMNNSREPWTQLSFEQISGDKEELFYNQVDPDYVETMQIDLMEGNAFDKMRGSTETDILVNETLVKHFGWGNPIAEQIPGKNFDHPHRIIGVVKDFHFSSLHQKIEPLILATHLRSVGSGITGLSTYMWPASLYQILVRIGPGDVHSVIQYLQNQWEQINPGKAFEYHFLNESLDAKYAEEKRWSKVIRASSIFAIIIAWLGLLGLMRLIIQRRTREVGIRRILGLTNLGMIWLLSKKFFLLILTGAVISWPIAWIGSNKWLESFSYRISPDPTIFLLTGLAVLFLALVSISVQSIKLARNAPVQSIKTE